MVHPQNNLTMESRTGTEVILNGKKYLYFAGTSYFQLHAHPAIIKAANEATNNYGIGTATTRAMTGTSPLLEEMEIKLAHFFNTEDAVYLPSGYLCSMAGLKALDEMGRYQVIFLDEGSHYSLFEGAAASGRKVIAFRNRDPEDLADKMKEHLGAGERPLVASDGLFPVMGNLAPLRDYLHLAEKYDGVLWIDDAHGVGILGSHGWGSCEALEIPFNKIHLGATLSKAFGAYGGIIAGSKEFIQKVRCGSVLTGSSSPMNAAVAAGIKGLELVRDNSTLRDRLWETALYLRESLVHMGIPVENLFIPVKHGTIPIFSFAHRDAASMKKIHSYLLKEGIYTQYTTYKGAGSEGVIRVVVSSEHKKVQIVRLTHALREAIRILGG
jgi:7-keto-8-aminopelargonate synthetase-like enzyme